MGTYKLILQSVKSDNATTVQDHIRKLFDISEEMAGEIVSSAPIIMLDTIETEDAAKRIEQRLAAVLEAGAEMELSDKEFPDIPRLHWHKPPPVAVIEESVRETPDEAVAVKYEFAVNKQQVFTCPACGAIFAMRRLSKAEQSEAVAQVEIAAPIAEPTRELLPVIEQPVPPQQATPSEEKEKQESKKKGMDQFFKELEALPVEGEKEVKLVEEEPKKKVALEPLNPAEAMKLLDEKIRKKPAPIKLERPQRRKRESSRPMRTGSGKRRGLRSPTPDEETEGANYGLALSRIDSIQKKNKAAEIIAELCDMDFEDARDITEKTIINVLRNVTEEEANAAAEQFKQLGIAARVTHKHKRHRRLR